MKLHAKRLGGLLRAVSKSLYKWSDRVVVLTAACMIVAGGFESKGVATLCVQWSSVVSGWFLVGRCKCRKLKG